MIASQLLGMAFISIGCAMLGFLSPANRGGLLTATLLLFTLMGVPAGKPPLAIRVYLIRQVQTYP